MSIISKKSLTSTAQKDILNYIGNLDDDLITIFIALRSCPTVTKGIVAPTSTPKQVGDIYVDTVAKKTYSATGTSSSADWTPLN